MALAPLWCCAVSGGKRRPSDTMERRLPTSRWWLAADCRSRRFWRRTWLAQLPAVPSLLMARLPGHVHLTPTEHRPWIERIAEFAAQLHALNFRHPRSDRGPTPGSHRSDSSRYRPARETRRSGRPPSMPWSRHHPRIVPSSCTATTCPSTCCGRAARSPDSPTGTASTEVSRHHVGQCRRYLASLYSPSWAEELRSRYESTVGVPLHPWWDLTPYSTMATTHQSRSRARLLVAASSTRRA